MKNSICYYKGKFEGEDINEIYDDEYYDDYDDYDDCDDYNNYDNYNDDDYDNDNDNDNYDDYKIKFEGEYLNGKRSGKGKEYDYYGRLKFEGEYLNGKRLNGKVYNENNKLEFEGAYLYKKNGMEKENNIMIMEN